jgi:acyl-CoA thioester hydrolase
MPAAADAPFTDPQAPAVYSHPLRVYWEDTDAGGVVFYANYLKFFERARTEWLRHLGVGQQQLREQTGAIFVVTDTQVRYRAPARLDDLLQVTVVLSQRGTASMTIRQQAWRAGSLLAEGDIRIGCVDATTFRPRRIPREVSDLVSTPSPADPPTPATSPSTAPNGTAAMTLAATP